MIKFFRNIRQQLLNHGKTGKWVCHKPSECKAAKETDNKDNKPKLQVNHMAVTSTASDEEDDF